MGRLRLRLSKNGRWRPEVGGSFGKVEAEVERKWIGFRVGRGARPKLQGSGFTGRFQVEERQLRTQNSGHSSVPLCYQTTCLKPQTSGLSRAISNLNLLRSVYEKASRLNVFQLDEIPKNLELRIAGEQRGVSGYGKRCGETIGIGHAVLGL